MEESGIDSWVRDSAGGHQGADRQALAASRVVQSPYAHESDPVERFFRELHRTIEGTWLADPARVRSQFGWGWSRDALETLSVNTKVIQS